MRFGSEPAPQPEDDFTRAEQAAAFLHGKTKLRPRVALVLGSGLGAFAANLTQAVRIPFAEIRNFPQTSAEGHLGHLVIGSLGPVPLACLQGRVHFYEGCTIRDSVFPVRVLGRLGVRALILTNAAGGINPDFSPGCLMVLKDHMNLQGANPLLGPNDERFGPRFLDLSQAYFRPYRQIAMDNGRRLGIEMFEGVYAAVCGPSYETPSEVRYLRAIGADAVGMSTVAETIVARHMGIRVLAISCITNMAAGILDKPLSHQEVLETGARVQEKFTQLLQAITPQIEDLASS